MSHPPAKMKHMGGIIARNSGILLLVIMLKSQMLPPITRAIPTILILVFSPYLVKVKTRGRGLRGWGQTI